MELSVFVRLAQVFHLYISVGTLSCCVILLCTGTTSFKRLSITILLSIAQVLMFTNSNLDSFEPVVGSWLLLVIDASPLTGASHLALQ